LLILFVFCTKSILVASRSTVVTWTILIMSLLTAAPADEMTSQPVEE